MAVECLNLHTSVLTLKIVMVISHGDSKDQRILDKVDMNLQGLSSEVRGGPCNPSYWEDGI